MNDDLETSHSHAVRHIHCRALAPVGVGTGQRCIDLELQGVLRSRLEVIYLVLSRSIIQDDVPIYLHPLFMSTLSKKLFVNPDIEYASTIIFSVIYPTV